LLDFFFPFLNASKNLFFVFSKIENKTKRKSVFKKSFLCFCQIIFFLLQKTKIKKSKIKHKYIFFFERRKNQTSSKKQEQEKNNFQNSIFLNWIFV